MATGLDRIIERIREDAARRADETVEAANAEAEKTLAEAEKQAESDAAALLEAAKKDDEAAAQRAEASAEFARRKAVLAAKQEAIRAVVAEARARLAAMPDAEYFEVLWGLLQKNAAPGKAEMRLSAKALARKPADFDGKAARLPGTEITVSTVPAEIEDGFLLVYDGIDINCTFDALFSAQADELSDIAGRVLFG